MNVSRGGKASAFFWTFFPANLSMLSIYMATMSVHMLHIDWKLLAFVVPQIVLIAVAVGAIGMLIQRRAVILNIVLGFVLGPIVAAVFIRVFY